MFQLVKSTVQPLTMALAEEFRDLPKSPTERDLIPSRLQHLRRKADAGQLVSFHWAKAQLRDQIYRMNGQHSATMLCELNGVFPENLYAHIDEYRVEDEQDLAMLFRQFDDRKSGRSAADVAGAYQGLVPELQGVKRSVGKLGIEAITWYRQYIESVKTPHQDEQYSLFHDVNTHEFLLWLNDVFSSKTPEFKNKPVVAAMWATFDKNPPEARAFWMEVARGGKELEELAPSTVLDAWLTSIKTDKELDIKPGEYYRGCIYAWNAHRADKDIEKIRYDIRKAGQAVSA